jgi:hypothetical protein
MAKKWTKEKAIQYATRFSNINNNLIMASCNNGLTTLSCLDYLKNYEHFMVIFRKDIR